MINIKADHQVECLFEVQASAASLIYRSDNGEPRLGGAHEKIAKVLRNSAAAGLDIGLVVIRSGENGERNEIEDGESSMPKAPDGVHTSLSLSLSLSG